MHLKYRFHNITEKHTVQWEQHRPPTWGDLRAFVAAYHRIRMLDYGPAGRIELVARLRPWEDIGEKDELEPPIDIDHELDGQTTVVIACRRVTELHIDHPYLTANELAEWRLFFQIIYRPMREIAERMPWPLFLLNVRTQHFNPFAMKRLASAPMPSYSREGEEAYWETCRDRFKVVARPCKKRGARKR